jgi:hypothetical protein
MKRTAAVDENVDSTINIKIGDSDGKFRLKFKSLIKIRK